MKEKFLRILTIGTIILICACFFIPSYVWASNDTVKRQVNKNGYVGFNPETNETIIISQEEADEAVSQLRKKSNNSILEGDFVATKGKVISNESQISPTSIIGGEENDNRFLITPDVRICMIYSEFTHGENTWKTVGTGFMIYKNILLTSGHCIYGHFDTDGDEVKDTWLWPSNCVIMAGVYEVENVGPQYAAGGKSVDASKIEQYYIGPSFASNASAQDDWGLIELKEDLGVGWMGFGYWGNWNNFINRNAYVQGYPADKRVGQWRGTGQCKAVSSYSFAHTAPTMGGMSGSPVWESDEMIACGIHGYGEINNVWNGNNMAVSINRDRFNFFVNMIKKSPFFTNDI